MFGINIFVANYDALFCLYVILDMYLSNEQLFIKCFHLPSKISVNKEENYERNSIFEDSEAFQIMSEVDYNTWYFSKGRTILKHGISINVFLYFVVEVLFWVFFLVCFFVFCFFLCQSHKWVAGSCKKLWVFVGIYPHPATKAHSAAPSLSHQWDQGEDQKVKR